MGKLMKNPSYYAAESDEQGVAVLMNKDKPKDDPIIVDNLTLNLIQEFDGQKTEHEVIKKIAKKMSIKANEMDNFESSSKKIIQKLKKYKIILE